MTVEAVRDLHRLGELAEEIERAGMLDVKPIAKKGFSLAHRVLSELNNRLTFLEHQAPTFLAANLDMEAANDG